MPHVSQLLCKHMLNVDMFWIHDLLSLSVTSTQNTSLAAEAVSAALLSYS